MPALSATAKPPCGACTEKVREGASRSRGTVARLHTLSNTGSIGLSATMVALQANAEPDLQQTGERLKPIIAGLVEGIMQLVVDPLTQAKVLHLPWCHI